MRWILTVFVLLVWSSAVIGAPVCTHVDMEWISRQAPLPPEAKIVYKKEQGALCEVVLAVDGDLIPLYAGQDFLVVGNLFRDKQFVTRETLESLADIAQKERTKADEKKILEGKKRQAFFQQNLSTLDDLTLFSFKPGKADKFLYMVTDPDCAHCKQLMPELEILALENQFEIKVILFPMLGPKSHGMAAQAICGKVSYEAYGKIQFEEDASGCSQADVLLKKTMDFFSQANLSFVPVVISGDGCWVVEGNDIPRVKHHLGIQDDGSSPPPSQGCKPVPEN